MIAAIKLALGFDGEVGLNLDALADVLTDVDEPGTLLLWSGASDFATDDDQYRHVLDVLRSAPPPTAINPARSSPADLTAAKLGRAIRG